MSTLSSDTVLPRPTLLRLLALLALVLAPHALHLPPWVTAGVLLAIVWRVANLQRGLTLPNRAVRVVLTLTAFAGIYASYGRIAGQHSGTALLVLMTVLKLLEMRSLRDVRVMVGLLYFLVFAQFLFSQEIWTVLWLLASVIAITGLLVEVSAVSGHATPPASWRPYWRRGAVIVTQALPLMVVLFILFPRIPGPIWGLPADAGVSRSGMPDSMSPGDISELILSDEQAFRIRFEGAPPPGAQLYWRGPVFERFDGRRWDAPEVWDRDARPALRVSGRPVGYEMVLEPTRGFSLFGLEMVARDRTPPGSRYDLNGQLLSLDRISTRRMIRAEAYPDYQLDAGGLPRWREARNLQIPDGRSPQARALAAQWRAQGLDPRQIVAAALSRYRTEPFRYTLQPPRLGREPVDEFLFDTRAGFCEHYASSFVVLMRAAGIPARVVIGYQGGERSRVGDDWVVRQSDAHAWAEVWLAEEGWRRVDPTAAVAPDRIEDGLREMFRDRPDELPDFMRRRGEGLLQLSRDQWDYLNAQWNRWFLAYGPELQASFLAHLGIRGWTAMVLWLTALLTGLLVLVSAWLWWSRRPAPPPDAASAQWRRLQRAFDGRSVSDPAEAPSDWVARMAAAYPAAAPALRAALLDYQALRYGPVSAEGIETRMQRLRRAVHRACRLRRQPTPAGAGR